MEISKEYLNLKKYCHHSSAWADINDRVCVTAWDVRQVETKTFACFHELEFISSPQIFKSNVAGNVILETHSSLKVIRIFD